MHNGLKFRDANGVERAVSSEHPLPVTGGGGGGGGGGDASAANQATEIARLNSILASIGSPSDPAWDGVAASASLISVMKRAALLNPIVME